MTEHPSRDIHVIAIVTFTSDAFISRYALRNSLRFIKNYVRNIMDRK